MNGYLSSPGISNPLKADWQRHVLACSGYLELGMLDDATLALEEIAPEDKNRNEVLGARVNLYMKFRRSKSLKTWDSVAIFGNGSTCSKLENDHAIQRVER